ncbi:DDE-type integrase/transposase/recombinase [Streptomyces sp. NPDC059679]|uniref:DDE-type integrase/transposase/recombinase n=1 Tax=Streptomyces sp. NPDC059679 TaxID=3346903 RepID=UPI00367904E2
MGRDFTAARPGTRLVGDITYLPTREGRLYLARWLDLATREVIGYAMADHHRAELVTDALRMAHGRGSLQPDLTPSQSRVDGLSRPVGRGRQRFQRLYGQVPRRLLRPGREHRRPPVAAREGRVHRQLDPRIVRAADHRRRPELVTRPYALA